jgi:hypothetical protein
MAIDLMDEVCECLQLEDWRGAERILLNAPFSLGEAFAYWNVNYEPGAKAIVRALVELEQRL